MIEDFINKVICGDCLKVMEDMSDNSVDLVLTDPPYGITKEDWDKVPSKEYFDEIFRISKEQIIFGGNFFDLPRKDGWIIWYKQPFLKVQSQAELIWTSFNMKMKVIHYRYAGNCEGYPNKLIVDYKKKSIHPTQKPVELLKNILSNYSKESDIILDPFLGSGTTAVAAKQLNRNFIGIEISENYCKIAKQRLRQEVLPL